jgi:hypothetical protein
MKLSLYHTRFHRVARSRTLIGRVEAARLVRSSRSRHSSRAKASGPVEQSLFDWSGHEVSGTQPADKNRRSHRSARSARSRRSSRANKALVDASEGNLFEPTPKETILAGGDPGWSSGRPVLDDDEADRSPSGIQVEHYSAVGRQPHPVAHFGAIRLPGGERFRHDEELYGCSKMALTLCINSIESRYYRLKRCRSPA